MSRESRVESGESRVQSRHHNDAVIVTFPERESPKQQRPPKPGLLWPERC